MSEKEIITSQAKEPDQLKTNPFEAALLKLSSREISQVQSINPEDIDLNYIGQQLEKAGLMLKISDQGQTSLAQSKFRSLDSDRGIGFSEAFRPRQDKNSAEEIIAWCQKRSKNGPLLHYPGKPSTPNSQGRGLMQLAADFIQLATLKGDSQKSFKIEFCNRLNQRVKKGLLWKQDPFFNTQVEEKFQGLDQPSGLSSSIPPGSAIELWNLLCSPEKIPEPQTGWFSI